jgi:darcynin-like uncharacterized protein
MHQRTFFMLLKASPHWHALDDDAQRRVFDDALSLVFNGYPELRMSRYKAGAFHSRCSHVLVWELLAGAPVSQYVEAIEALHAQPFFAAPLFEIVDVIPGVQDDDEEELLPVLALAL